MLGAGLVGAWWWLRFFSYGAIATANYDWIWQIGYVRLVHEALVQRVLPLYRAQLVGLPWYDWADNRVEVFLYWAHPLTTLSPQLLLLTIVPPGAYLVVNILLFYALGFAGLLALARRYHLSAVPFVLLLVLLYGNGHLVAHMTSWQGWEGYFLVSWFYYFAFRACEGDRSMRTATQLALVLAALMFQGCAHVLAYLCMFLVLLTVAAPWLAAWIAAAALGAGALSAIRVLPTLAMFPYQEAARSNTMFNGYLSGRMLLNALAQHGMQDKYEMWWEYDAYIGPVALGFLVVFGLVAPCFTRDWRRHLILLVPVTVFGVWSIYWPNFLNYGWWHDLDLPVLSVERMPSRFLIIPLTFVIVEACITLQRSIDRHRAWIGLGLLVLGLTASGLEQHANEWRPNIHPGPLVPSSVAAHLLADPAPLQEFRMALPNAAPPASIVYDTTRYRWALFVGGMISLVTVIGAGVVVRRRGPSKRLVEAE